MKKLVIAAAVLGAFAGTAQAQTNVTLYGIVDGDLRFDHTNAGTLHSVASGGESGSRWGLRGTEDLGGGLRATFVLEQGFDIGNNGVPQGNVPVYPGTAANFSTGGRLFGRTSTVGLAGGFGEVRFGRTYTPIFLTWANADPFGAGLVGQMGNVTTGSPTRYDTALWYDTPTMGGFKGAFAFSTGNSDPATAGIAKSGGNKFGISVTYATGPIYASYGYSNQKNNSDNNTTKLNAFAATYDFGLVKPAFLYWTQKSDGLAPATPAIDQKNYFLGATVPLGQWSILLGYGHINDKSTLPAVNLGNPKANFLGLAAEYNLSKRTALYTSYGKFSLTNGPSGNPFVGYAGIADASNSGLYQTNNLTGATGANVNPYSYQFGLRHKF